MRRKYYPPEWRAYRRSRILKLIAWYMLIPAVLFSIYIFSLLLTRGPP